MNNSEKTRFSMGAGAEGNSEALKPEPQSRREFDMDIRITGHEILPGVLFVCRFQTRPTDASLYLN